MARDGWAAGAYIGARGGYGDGHAFYYDAFDGVRGDHFNAEWTDYSSIDLAFRMTFMPEQAPPVADAGGPYTVVEGGSVVLDASASSDVNDPTELLTFEWDLDYDGVTFDVDATGITPSVSFPDAFSARPIAVRVTGTIGDSDIATTTLTVNNVAPTVIGLSPLNTAAGSMPAGTSSLDIRFSEVVLMADLATSYQLRGAAADGLLGTADDSIFPVSATVNQELASLSFSPLLEDIYRLTVKDTITDVASDSIDGDKNGVAGGNAVFDFVVDSPTPPVQVVSVSPDVATGLVAGATTLDVNFSGVISGGEQALHYELRGAGDDGSFNTTDDVLIAMSASYTGTTATLTFDPLPLDQYRLTVKSGDNPSTLNGGSSLLSSDDLLQLEAWLGESNLTLTNIFTKTVSGGETSTDFHTAADGQGRTFSVIEVLPTQGNSAQVIGGYNPLSWNSSGGYNYSYTDAERTAFLFNLDTLDLQRQKLGVGEGTYQTLYSSEAGPTFGGGFDIFVNSSLANGSARHYSYGDPGSGTSDPNIIGRPYGGNDSSIDFGTIEVFMISAGGGLRDLAGGAIDGDADGIAGGDFVVESHFTTPNGFIFDTERNGFGAGQFVQGLSNSFDGLNRLQVDGQDFTPVGSSRDDDSFRTLLTPTQTMSSLDVSREITVPNSGGYDFARTVDVFHNATGSTINATVRIVGNLGSDGATTVFNTSGGDTNVDTTDHWIGTDDADGSGTPAIIHYIHGPIGLQPTDIQVVGDNIFWTYSLSVAAGETVRLAQFTIVDDTRQGVEDAANALVTNSSFGGEAGAFLTQEELDSLANFVFNTPPIADARGPYTVDEGSLLTLDGSGSVDNEDLNSTLTFEWDLNYDGVTFNVDLIGEQPQVTFPDNIAQRAIALRVVDPIGETDIAVTTLAINNVAPTPTIVSISETKLEGTAINVSASAADPAGGNDTLTYSYQVFKDGATTAFADGSGVDQTSFGFTPDDNGNYEIMLTVSDEDGGSATVSQTFDVGNVKATLSGLLAATINEGGTTTLTGTITDPGTLDTFTLDVDWGDPLSPNNTETYSFGASATGSQTFTLTHSYLDDPAGTSYDDFVVRVGVADDDSTGILYESATLGGNGSPRRFGIGANQFLGVRFQVESKATTSRIGLNQMKGSGEIFGAIVRLTGPTDSPDSADLSTDDLVGSVSITVDAAQGEYGAHLPVVLDPGWYALVYGSGLFGATGSAEVPGNDTDIGTPSYFFRDGGGNYLNGTDGVRYFVEGLGDTLVSGSSATVLVNNVAPTPVIDSISTSRVEGTQIDVTASATDPAGANDTLTYNYEAFKDGALFASDSGIDQTIFHFTPDDNGNFEIVLTVRDEDGGSDSVSQTITVENRGPLVQNPAIDNPVIHENESATFSGTIFDPGTLDTHEVLINWGDGSTPTLLELGVGVLSFSAPHQYLDDGPSGVASHVYPIEVTVTDDDGGSDSASTAVTVDNVAPTVTLNSVPMIDENGTATLTGTITDSGSRDTFELDLGWGDPLSPENSQSLVLGSAAIDSNGMTWHPATRQFSVTHRYPDDGLSSASSDDYTINLNVTDDDGGSGASDATVTVNNVAPSAFISAPNFAVEQQLITVELTAGDVAADEASGFEYTVDWGDGQTDTIVASANNGLGVTATHIYSTAASYNIVATATDKDGGSGSAAHAVTISEITGEGLQDVIDAIVASGGDPVITFETTTNSDLGSIIRSANQLSVDSVTFDIVVDLNGQNFNGQVVNLPTGVNLILQNGSLQGASPALTVTAGSIIAAGMTFTNATDAPTILVSGGVLTLRDSIVEESTSGEQAAIEIAGGIADLGSPADLGGNTFLVHEAGLAIRNSGSATVTAFGNTFQIDDGVSVADITSPYRIEDEISHALDASAGGLVEYVANHVYVTQQSDSIQRGVNTVVAGGTVHVEQGNFSAYAVADKLVTVAFEDGPVVSQEQDPLVPTLRRVVVTGTDQDDQILFKPGIERDDVDVSINGVADGSYTPTGSLVAFAGLGNDRMELTGSLQLQGWLYGEQGDDWVKGGGGDDVLVGGDGDDLLVGNSGRDILIGGFGSDRLVGNAGDDILMAGHSTVTNNEVALSAILAEWTSERSYESRRANILGDASSEEFADLLNGDSFLKVGGEDGNVFDDDARDILTGSSGIDWFFANMGESGVKDRTTDLGSDEFAEIGGQVTSGESAGIGFWQNKHGQQLIAAGGAQLAQWLTTNFGNVFGKSLVGATGEQVAEFYRDQLFFQKSKKSNGSAKVDAQFMATALGVYFSNRNLAGDVGAAYGFSVSDTGLGVRAVNVGFRGDAFGVEDGMSLTIMQLLLATNASTDSDDLLSGFASIYDLNGDGVIDAEEARLRTLSNDLYSWINSQ